MVRDATVTLSQTAYDALIARNEELEDRLAAMEADDGSRIPHAVALAIMRGDRPVAVFRKHRGLTLRALAEETGIAASYLSEIERGRKPGSAAVLTRIAVALDTRIDVLKTDIGEAL
ncbi:MAG: helix-turn-helix transcriptional regulator [Chloroflexi bacterium]|nr:helix-turn-helix transcriptional regulator [Chloroflexota bacterium]